MRRPDTMVAAMYHGPRDIRVERVVTPRAGTGELLLEVHSAGVCGTDASEFGHGPKMYPVSEPHPVTGHLGPLIPGHEFGGRVVEVGAGVEGFTEGDLVASGSGISCGRCDRCREGRTSLCDLYATVGLHRNGGLAQYCAVPASVCFEVGSLGLDDDGAALVQPMSIAVHAVRRGRMRPPEDALVIGVGGVGAFVVYVAADLGATVVAVDLDPERLKLAAALGAQLTVLASPDRSLAQTLGERDFVLAVVFEASGSPAALADALSTVRTGGRVVAIGLQEERVPLDVRDLTLREIELVGTNAHAFAADVPEAARLIAARQGQWSDVAPIALPLDRLVEGALRPLLEGRGEQIKYLVDPWATNPRPTFGRE